MPSVAPPALRLRRPSRRRSAVAAAALAAVLLLVAAVATATGAPATMRLVSGSPSLGHEIAIAAPGGGTFTADPGRGTVSITPSGGSALTTSAWCVDPTRLIAEGVDYPVDLTSAATAPDLDTPAAREAAWLIGRADALVAAAADPGREAAAIQVAVWQLTGMAADVPAVTGDAALDARVAELRASAAGRAPAEAVALAAAAGPATVGAPVTIAVSGAPGASVSLQASGATLSAAAVTLDAGGRASLTATPTAPGEAVVTARTTGGLLWRAAHLPGSDAPQDMAYVTPRELTAAVTVTAAAPPPGQVAAPTTPVARPTAPAPARLRVSKRAPRRAVRGRSIPYLLTVRNVSRRVARGVVIRDRLPRGTALLRRPPGARVIHRTVVWRIGTLPPGAGRRVGLRLRTFSTGPSRVRNVARASAANARTVRARAVTRLRSPVRVRPARVSPAVTG